MAAAAVVYHAVEGGRSRQRTQSSRPSSRRRKSFVKLDPILVRALELPVAKRLADLSFTQASRAEVEALCFAIDGPTEEEAYIHRIKDLVGTQTVHWHTNEKEVLVLLLKDKLGWSNKQVESSVQGGEAEALAVNADELFEVLHHHELTNSFNLRCADFRKRMEQKEQAERREAAIAATEVSREDFAAVIDHTVARDDAFMTMPVSLIFIILLMAIVQTHLAIFRRQKMEKSLEDWLNGRDPLTSADRNVDNMESFWEWALGVGIPGALGQPKQLGGFTQYTLASRHVLIGDVRMSYTLFDGTTAVEWLLHTDVAAKHLEDNPGDYLNAATAAGTHLSEQKGWNAYLIEKISFSFITYDELVQAYAATETWVKIDRYGQAVPVMNSDAVYINPYPSFEMYIADVLFAILVLHGTIKESISLCATMRLGWSEFKDYWDLWNIVDWIAIFLSFCAMGLWAGLCVCMTEDCLHSFLSEEDKKINRDVMTLDGATLERIYDQLQLVRMFYLATHVALAVNCAMLVAKFFKSFQSNPRLKVVTDTFVISAPDLLHFFIIFCTLFLPFTLTGHILFGNDISALSSVYGSINTGTTTLLGDYDWYLEYPLEQFYSRLPSGMPVVLLFLWFFAFHFVITLVVLNMLLGIILENYLTVEEDLEKLAEAPPIWVQVRDFLRFRKQTRGFIKLEAINRGLQNDEDPSHKEEDVTIESLQRAFESMSEKQARWLMDKFLKPKVYNMKEVKHVCTDSEMLLFAEDSVMTCFEMARELDSPNADVAARVDEMVDVIESMKKECAEFKAKLTEFSAAQVAAKSRPPGKSLAASTPKSRDDSSKTTKKMARSDGLGRLRKSASKARKTHKSS